MCSDHTGPPYPQGDLPPPSSVCAGMGAGQGLGEGHAGSILDPLQVPAAPAIYKPHCWKKSLYISPEEFLSSFLHSYLLKGQPRS